MPARNWAIRPKIDGTEPAPRRPGDALTQDPRPRQALGLRERRPQLVEAWVDIESRNPGFGDLPGGGVAAAALVVMVATGMTLWLAIPLAVATYVAIALLRPARAQREERVDDNSRQHPHIDEVFEDHDVVEVPERAFIHFEAVAARFGLTRREREVLPLLAQRRTDREIAEQLQVSHRTAMNHTANILGKLGLASRRDVARFVAEHTSLPSPTASNGPE